MLRGGNVGFFPRSLLPFLISVSLRLPSGYSDGAPGAKNGTNADSQRKSRGGSGSMVLMILVGIAAVVLLSFFLYKLWQRKKRAEQYARLLKLFEEDDELEVELGLRD
ncbi:hypothetical protein MLD38_023149 [Melastoma candidum]|uniref:Uncharacterized protein n=1 Tax=Melastoma candidum TaxID=119954 RepID=A0ACB9QLH4_9MYRT|nr:hypothetical protein MLD38_023149 [Melastoma candidum]